MFVLYFSLSLLLYNAEGTCSVLKAATVVSEKYENPNSIIPFIRPLLLKLLYLFYKLVWFQDIPAW